jgi:5-methylcytosine-specific restriction endonuclease McrA
MSVAVAERDAPSIKWCKGWRCGQPLGINDPSDYCPRHDPKPPLVPKHKRRKAYDYAWRKQRERVLRRDEYTCQIRLRGCTIHADQVDHVRSLMSGGPLHVSDSELRAACGHCNGSRGASEGNRAR